MTKNPNNKHTFSCEFFPPRTDKGMDNLIIERDKLDDAIKPSFYSVTFGAGGSTRDRTLETVEQLLSTSDTSVVPHISCIGSTGDEIKELLNTYKEKKINRLVTLRGDIPEDGKGNNEYNHANELVEFIRQETGDYFHIEVAAYPEYHPESLSPETDISNLKRKVDAGANSAITQYFYNIDAFRRFMDNCHNNGIDITITPGIMPITSCEGLIRFSDRCGAEIPRWIRKQLESYADDTESLLAFGTDVVSELCNKLLEEKIEGLHFYTLNRSQATIDIWNNIKSK